MMKKKFTDFLLKLADRIKKETGGKYNPTAFRNMVREKGGVETAKQLINDKTPSEGYTKLWELGLLNLSVEAQVLESEGGKWHCLFAKEKLETCRKRLKKYEYKFKDQ